MQHPDSPDGGIAYLVRYDGLPKPVDGFVDHYETTHAAILKQFPGLRGLTLMTPAGWRDPQPVNAGKTDFLAMMTFDDTAALSAALQSPMREQARADFANLPVGDATVIHQAMHICKVL